MSYNRTMKISSPAFEPNQPIPLRYAYKGQNLSPPLVFADVPEGAKSLALVCHDPDAPTAGGFTHWVVWNIPPGSSGLKENEVPTTAHQGLTDWNQNTWGGPMPPSGTHRYIFYLYALKGYFNLPSTTNKALLEKAIDGQIIETATLTGTYSA